MHLLRKSSLLLAFVLFYSTNAHSTGWYCWEDPDQDGEVGNVEKILWVDFCAWGDFTCGPTLEARCEADGGVHVATGDNCPYVYNPDQFDSDDDGVGDACEPGPNDPDGDGRPNATDNCPNVSNSNQQDSDNDGLGDACDLDDDDDGVPDGSDAFPLDASESSDADSDGVGDNSDNCPVNSNPDQVDTDSDEQGDICDLDDDNDGVSDGSDAFPLDASESSDADSDGVGGNSDNCSVNSNPDQVDTDSDGLGDVCDEDDDNDGVSDGNDAFPLDSSESLDTDSDGVGDNSDNCPVDSNPNQLDSDSDGRGNVCDLDSDKDGFDDHLEIEFGRDPLVPDYLIAAGWNTSCAKTDIGVSCWGDLSGGQGNIPSGLTNIRDMAVTASQVCVVEDSQVHRGVNCWGGGQMPPALSNVTDIDGYGFHMCAISQEVISCWGDNSNNKATPPALINPIAVAVGTQHSCAIDEVSVGVTEVVCWGSDSHGQSSVPALINPTAIDAGDSLTCAVHDQGKTVCWGRNDRGQAEPIMTHDARSVSAGMSMGCVRAGAIEKTALIVKCWGGDNQGQSSSPELLASVGLDSGLVHSCAIDLEKGLACWGLDDSQQSTVPVGVFVDFDQDGVPNSQDNCPFLAAVDTNDSDGDSLGDPCDEDDDNDGVNDVEDFYPFDPDLAGDSDGDGSDRFEEDRAGTSDMDPSERPYWSLSVSKSSTGVSLGTSVSGLGDIDLDGVDEYAVSGQYGTFVFDSETHQEDYSYDFGGVVTSAGDVNNDGYKDFMVGDVGEFVKIISGENGQEIYSILSEGGNFGAKLAGIGDVNRDDYDDFAIGWSNTGVDQGRVFVYSGESGQVLYELAGDTTHEKFGFSIDKAGDLNRDGYQDIIVGAAGDEQEWEWYRQSNWFGPYKYSGFARAFNGLTGEELYTFDFGEAAGYFNYSVSYAGDLNRDGHSDVAVLAGREKRGELKFFSGKNGELIESLTISDLDRERTVVSSIRNLGDFNGNGYEDIAVVSPDYNYYYEDSPEIYKRANGFAKVIDGKSFKLEYLFERGSYRSIDNLGDIEGDGLSDFIVGKGGFRIILSSDLANDPDLDFILNGYDEDDDGDGILDVNDEMPLDTFESQDSDGDGIGDKQDNCVDVSNYKQKDIDGDGEGDLCDENDDNDGLTDVEENTFGTDSGLIDTDKDSIDDQYEITLGSNPLAADYLLAAGRNTSCIKDDFGISCWGDISQGQDNIPTGLLNIADLAVNSFQACVIEDSQDNKSVQCWGGGQMPPALTETIDIDGFSEHMCAVANGAVTCWGINDLGQSAPPQLLDPVAVTAGGKHSCAIDQNVSGNTVHCWGANNWGQSTVPVLLNPTVIDAGENSTCALHNGGELACWGKKVEGDVPPPLFHDGVDVSVGANMACIVRREGVVECWGEQGAPWVPPVEISGAAQIDSGDFHSCVLDSSQTVVCWGESGYGQTDLPVGLHFDADNDGVLTQNDNCPFVSNSDLVDTDSDGVGNVCDEDDDNDGVNDELDVFPLDPQEARDNDLDGIGDNSDNCIFDENPNQNDLDDDGKGDACDLDDDNDGVEDENDAYPFDLNRSGDRDFDGSDFFEEERANTSDLSPEERPFWWRTLTSGYDGDGYGSSMDSLGDMNGDGVEEFIVGAPKDSTSGENFGVIRIYNGLDGAVLSTLYGNSEKQFFGLDVSSAGDINSDGYDDFAVVSRSQNGVGFVTVYSGLDGALLRELYDETSFNSSGSVIESVGDVNNDDYVDILIGEPSYTSGEKNNRGKAEVRSGKNGEVIYAITGESENDRLGLNVGAVGDVNGDNYSDFAISAKNYNFEDYRYFSIYSGATGEILHTIYGDAKGHLYDVSPFEDVDSDGVDEFVVVSGVALDIILEVYGKHGLLRRYTVPRYDVSTSLYIDVLGDVNGDGMKEVILGAERQSPASFFSLINFDSGEEIFRFKGDGFGGMVTSLGDIDQDGVKDFVMASNSSGDGHARIYLTSDLMNDRDLDFLINSADLDDDNDGVLDVNDSFPFDPSESSDSDSDGVGNNSDNCVFVENSSQFDFDSDGFGNECDNDDDNDGLSDSEEMVLGTNPVYVDTDKDGISDFAEVEMGGNPLSAEHLLALGWNTSCATTGIGVSCWGDIGGGQNSAPATLSNIQDLAVNASQTCVIEDSQIHQGVNCWGGGQMPPVLNNTNEIDGYGFHMCAISSGSVVCWGDAAYGKTLPPVLEDPIALAVGTQHSCAIDATTSGLEVVCWGDSRQGQRAVPALQNPVAIDAGDRTTCVIHDGGKVACWGDSGTSIASPPAINDAVEISVGRNMACALRSSGSLDCWGENIYGQSTPPGNDAVLQISSGFMHSCELDARQGVSCWGWNDNGQISIPGGMLIDPDGDNVFSPSDNCPFVIGDDVSDTDGDNLGNICDEDDDNDGVLDIDDDLPLDATETLDTDGDGVGNNADWDDDGDKVPDAVDAAPLDAVNSAEASLPLDREFKGGHYGM